MARIRGSSNRTGNANANAYEEARKQRLHENNKKLQDLGIMSLSKSLSKVIKPVQKSLKLKSRIRKEGLDTSDVRRSNRSRGSATPYSEEFKIELARSRPRKKSKARSMTSLARPLDEVKTASNAQRAYTEKCATTFQRGLTSGHPCFIKSMRHSHVYSGFWLGLPSDFCQNYLLEDDTTMVLEGPDGVEHESLYKAMKNGLSAGWRHFALVHKLDDGDALIFELTQPQKFKIYFFRVSELYRKKKEAKNVKSVA